MRGQPSDIVGSINVVRQGRTDEHGYSDDYERQGVRLHTECSVMYRDIQHDNLPPPPYLQCCTSPGVGEGSQRL